jgi:CCR4-NOT complex subunit CAF16
MPPQESDAMDTTKAFEPPKPLPTVPDYGPNAVEVKNLTFSYTGHNSVSTLEADAEAKAVLKELNLDLATGSRCLLIGANGSGKSTLLRILAGRHLTKNSHATSESSSCCRVLGLNAFHDTKLNFHRAYLDCDWGLKTVSFVGGAMPLMADIEVHKMMEKLQASYPERRDELLTMLGINLNWRMHQLSDGQRRRVQLFLGLIRPFKILLLDEVTTSLDVCVRQDLLRWLVKESDERGATIVYATHIFDGLDDWATHLYHLNGKGQCGWQGKMQELEIYQKLKADNHPAKMLAIAEHWLRAELEEMRRLKKTEKPGGAIELDPTARDQGGYKSGRMQTDDELKAKAKRQGRLSDMMGNSGTLDKVHRTGGN